jgi:hypothetical protein
MKNDPGVTANCLLKTGCIYPVKTTTNHKQSVGPIRLANSVGLRFHLTEKSHPLPFTNLVRYNRLTNWSGKLVANLWTEFAAHRSEALATNAKELQTLDFFGGCKFRKDKNLGFCRAYGSEP